MYNAKYGDLGVYGRCRYDFYLLRENKYIEITSFDKSRKWWPRYLRNIVRKKKYVQDVLGGKFEFIQMKLSKNEIKYVRKNMRKNSNE